MQLFWLFEIYLNLFIYLLYLFLKSIDYALRFSQFSPLYPPLSPHPLPSGIPPPLSSCPCLVHRSSLRSVSYTISVPPTLVMPNFILLLPCTFAPPIPPFPLPAEIPPCDVHFSDSVPVLVVCLVLVFLFFFFSFWFSCCEL